MLLIMTMFKSKICSCVVIVGRLSEELSKSLKFVSLKVCKACLGI
jgi:hypothetical protein